MTRSNRLLVLLAGAVFLGVLGYLAVPWIWMFYMLFFGPGLACGNNCDRPEFTAPGNVIVIGAVSTYVLFVAVGVRWVMKGEAD